jgi:hypothetical protein
VSTLEKLITLDEVKYLLKLVFDIDDFIGDGIFSLEVYNDRGERELEMPFASSRGLSQKWWIEAREIFKSLRY